MNRITLDLAMMGSKESAHDYLKRILRFPDYYGRNLDALHDCLTDIHEPVTVKISRDLERKCGLGEYGRDMIRVFLDSARANPYLFVKITR